MDIREVSEIFELSKEEIRKLWHIDCGRSLTVCIPHSVHTILLIRHGQTLICLNAAHFIYALMIRFLSSTGKLSSPRQKNQGDNPTRMNAEGKTAVRGRQEEMEVRLPEVRTHPVAERFSCAHIKQKAQNRMTPISNAPAASTHSSSQTNQVLQNQFYLMLNHALSV
uniref:Uncharacterized protein n=1 Tax=Candidatus Kentrum sp. TUN TaxID=2126343 RepID=A0A451A3A6_9GAMM|nr:MAG: hypothetical protein BECKTUN1418D_GA0071000_105715 [Candidatus Kentron sp. TUN]VFK60513.1 MAG: hypothetical protein BECKTUN1418F_GA0071002_12174 [Candidatus Kentron sp. TUN]VFK69835.1 MAG: hypothetical protein BECKTUN1418E_GA0071001_12164 [Candidatus Kentron sp. TUN]